MNRSATDLKVGGLTRLSTCDWPGELVATVFCQGCAWDCPYCHNPGLRSLQSDQLISWSSILDFLRSRTKLLDAVVFSGGEPLMQPAIIDAVAEVRNLGFRVGLHTTGMMPERFAALLPKLDWVGFDVKAPLAAYSRVTGVEHSGEKTFASLKALIASSVLYEVRTTLHPALLGMDELLKLKEELLGEGVTHFVVQHFRAQGSRVDRLPASYATPTLPPGIGKDFLKFQTR
ncbi:MAG: anaerobic ribonucleoside-triphosphate reductase activating protein [Terracidiphilus sp.]